MYVVTSISMFTGMWFIEFVSPHDKIFTVLPESQKLTVPLISTRMVMLYRFYRIGKCTFGTVLVHLLARNLQKWNFAMDYIHRLATPAPAFSVYRISFLWYPMLACISTVVIGIVVSAITEKFGWYDTHQSLRKNRNTPVVVNGTRLTEINVSGDQEDQTSEPFLRKHKIIVE